MGESGANAFEVFATWSSLGLAGVIAILSIKFGYEKLNNVSEKKDIIDLKEDLKKILIENSDKYLIACEKMSEDLSKEQCRMAAELIELNRAIRDLVSNNKVTDKEIDDIDVKLTDISKQITALIRTSDKLVFAVQNSIGSKSILESFKDND